MQLQKGRHGQFDILVEGRPVVSRKGGLLAKLLGKPWPSEGELIAAVRAGTRDTSSS